MSLHHIKIWRRALPCNFFSSWLCLWTGPKYYASFPTPKFNCFQGIPPYNSPKLKSFHDHSPKWFLNHFGGIPDFFIVYSIQGSLNLIMYTKKLWNSCKKQDWKVFQPPRRREMWQTKKAVNDNTKIQDNCNLIVPFTNFDFISHSET